MIDLHCHVLWGIDDGPRSLDESVGLCRALISKGISGIVATPHYIPGTKYIATSECVREKVRELQMLLADEAPKLKIYAGMELFITPELPELLKSGTVIPLNNSRYILVEMSTNSVPNYIDDVLFKLQLDGYIPVFAHPERYHKSMGIERIQSFIAKGALMQINTGSIIGKHGKEVRQFADILLKAGVVHFIATDSHRSADRFASVANTREILKDAIGSENAEKILFTNPQRLIDNLDIEYMEPVQQKRGFFKKLTRILKR
jgi:protein-tyrosine phosphatase